LNHECLGYFITESITMARPELWDAVQHPDWQYRERLKAFIRYMEQCDKNELFLRRLSDAY